MLFFFQHKPIVDNPPKQMHNKLRKQSKKVKNFGEKISPYQDSYNEKTDLPFDINRVINPYDFICLFVSDDIIDKIVTETKRYAGLKNDARYQTMVDRSTIRCSQAIMYLTGYITPASKVILWQKREDSNNKLVSKAMSIKMFKDTMRYTHFSDNTNPNTNNPYWKVQTLVDTINNTAQMYVRQTKYSSIDETMVKVSTFFLN